MYTISNEKFKNPDFKTRIVLKDFSKYGTIVNGKQIETNTEIDLNDGDAIKFGIYNSDYMYVNVQSNI